LTLRYLLNVRKTIKTKIMKKLNYIFAILIVFITCNISFAQKTKFEVGLESGPSVIRIRQNKAIRKYYPSLIGFSGGFFGQVNLNKSYSLRTNIHFDRKGFSTGKLPYSAPTGQIIRTANYISNYDYLTLPILFRANFGQKIKFFVNAGPYFGYLINARTIVKPEGPPNSIYNIKNSFLRKSDKGISSGLGFYWPFKSKHALSFELRNSLGAKSPNGHGNNATSLLISLTRSFGTINKKNNAFPLDSYTEEIE
jgi:Outer membrane protein beta-barrel domain